jgi:hypothetical protein
MASSPFPTNVSDRKRNNAGKAEWKSSSISYYYQARKARGKRGRERAFMASQFMMTRDFEVVGT